MEGRPSLSKCTSIKKKREAEQEVLELQSNTILETKLRHQKSDSPPRSAASYQPNDSFLKHICSIADSD